VACGRSDLADYVATKHEETNQQQLMTAAKGKDQVFQVKLYSVFCYFSQRSIVESVSF